MFAMTVFTGVMVLGAALVGVAEIVRDLVQDYQAEGQWDWFWQYPVTGALGIPSDMVFELPDNDPEFSIEVQSEEGELVKLYFGYDKDHPAIGEGEFIDITSMLHKEIDLEYAAESKNYRTQGNLTRMPIH
jgi:hypothetical protein